MSMQSALGEVLIRTGQFEEGYEILRTTAVKKGCSIILWDRLFGTYCGDTEVGQIGAGKAVPLSIKEQLALAFYPKEKLIDL